MSTTVAAKEIGKAWLAYVEETFGGDGGVLRPQVQEEFKRLSDSDAISQERELWRGFIDNLIDKILDCPPDQRGALILAIDPRSLAYLMDRIQCGTELLTGLAQRDLKLDLQEGEESLPAFFRLMLLQNPAAC